MTELRKEDMYADAYHWTELAHKHKIRLPLWSRPCTPSGMRKFLKKIGLSVEDYLARTNAKNLREFPSMNQDWPLRAWAGIELEWLDEKNREPVPSIESTWQPKKRSRRIKDLPLVIEGKD